MKYIFIIFILLLSCNSFKDEFKLISSYDNLLIAQDSLCRLRC